MALDSAAEDVNMDNASTRQEIAITEETIPDPLPGQGTATISGREVDSDLLNMLMNGNTTDTAILKNETCVTILRLVFG